MKIHFNLMGEYTNRANSKVCVPSRMFSVCGLKTPNVVEESNINKVSCKRCQKYILNHLKKGVVVNFDN